MIDNQTGPCSQAPESHIKDPIKRLFQVILKTVFDNTSDNDKGYVFGTDRLTVALRKVKNLVTTRYSLK